jgi:curved DNA-binding protein CbpA
VSVNVQGGLGQGVLPGVLRELYVGRRTGMLNVTKGQERRSIRFQRGHIVHAESDRPEDHLGETLVRLGLLAPAQLERATAEVRASGRRLGAVLVEQGVLSAEQLDDALAIHVREILLRLFTWTEGDYAFADEPEAPQPAAPSKLSTGEMILEAVRSVEDPGVVRYALGDTDRVLGLSSDPLLRFQKIALTPVDGFLLSRIDGTLSAREVIEMAPVSQEDAERSLFGLLCTGIAEYLQVPPKQRRPTLKEKLTGRFKRLDLGGQKQSPPASGAAPSGKPPAAPPPSTPQPTQSPDGKRRLTVRFERLFAEEALKASAQAGAASAAPAAPTAPAVEERRKEIETLHAGLKSMNHFEVLGIPRASTEKQVKEAYFRLARLYHPDTQHDPALADLAGSIEAIFIRLGQAYETLRNTRSRGSYEERLGPSRTPLATASAAPQQPTQGASGSAPQAPPAAQPAPAGPPPPPDRRAIDEALRTAEKRIAEEKYWEAIQLVEPLLEHLQGRMLARARLVLARCYAKNPNWVKRAEEELQKVVQLDAANADAYLMLARIYAGQRLKSRATSMARKVLELQPEHQDAAALLAELSPEPPPDAPAGGGLLKKLFKR